MSIELLKSELSKLSQPERQAMMAFLVQLNREKAKSAGGRSLSDVLNDQRPGQWLTLDEADQRLDWLPDPA